MALLSLRNVSLAFGGPRLLDQVELQIEQGERVCLLGRNGEGKSTLLRLIQGEIEPDEGQVIRQQGLRIARLPQDVPRDQTGTVADQVARRARRHRPSRDRFGSSRFDLDLSHGSRPGRTLRRPLLRHEAARSARSVSRRRARYPAPRRADQPPRYRRHPLARDFLPRAGGDPGLRHSRPGVPGKTGHANRRARPRPALRLGLRLSDVS